MCRFPLIKVLVITDTKLILKATTIAVGTRNTTDKIFDNFKISRFYFLLFGREEEKVVY